MKSRSNHCWIWATFGSLLWVVSTLGQDVPTADSITQQIDQRVRERWSLDNLEPAPRCSDLTFVRRIHLDLAGRIPSVDEVDAFLADASPDKRRRLIDRLLDNDDFVQHFADVFDVLLMGRTDPGKYRQREKNQWRSYLENVFRQNRRWDRVVEEILLARPKHQRQRGAVWFLYERENKHQEIAEAIAPAIFGFRIECAQCHDHMMADEIKQEHYWGLVAFFNRGKNSNSARGPAVQESAIGGFSDFANLTGDSSPNVLSFLDSEVVDEARPEKDQKQQDADDLYLVSKTKGEPRVPKFSRRERFVADVTRGHPRVPLALVNRVWAIMLGRGLVHPFDEMDSMHDPSHPELLTWLAADFVKSDFDLKRLVRGIANSEVYQLDSVQPSGAEDPATFAWYLERPLIAEQLARSMSMALRGTKQVDEKLLSEFRQQFPWVLPDDAAVVTIGDALFLSNQPQLDSYISQSNKDGQLLARLGQSDSPRQRVDSAFRVIFGRSPDQAEREHLTNYLRDSEGSPAAIRQVVWALLTSAEFRFNH